MSVMPCLFFDQTGVPKMAFCPGTLDEPTNLRSKAHIFLAMRVPSAGQHVVDASAMRCSRPFQRASS
ncbi:MAG TPA: hypothetical protein VK550_19805 [Polyangiaceae bacterium]|nr:hypothetical protein [Polyangiaceae bacterium]